MVTEAYDNYLQHKLNRMWLTLQSCFNQIILHHGDNDYSIEHILKEKLEWAGQLPDILDVVDEDTYQMNKRVTVKATHTMKAIHTMKATQ